LEEAIDIGQRVYYEVQSEGTVLPVEVEVTDIVVSREAGQIPSATFMVVDGEVALRDFEASSADFFVPGKKIDILVGFGSESDVTSIFNGIVIKQSVKLMGNGATCLTIECRHEVYKMTLGRKSRVFENKTDTQIIETLLGDYFPTGSAVKLEIDAPGQSHERMIQFNATDWDFMMARIDASAALCYVGDNTIEVKSPLLDAEAVKELSFGVNLLEFETSLDARTQPAEVVATRWIPSQGEITEDKSGNPLAGSGDLSASDLNGKTGFDKETIHYSGSRFENDNLEQLAKSKMMRYNLAKVRGVAKIVGSADVEPGTMVELIGIGTRMSGKAFVGGARHYVGQGAWHSFVQIGLTPKFHTERYDVHSPKAAGTTPAVSGLQIGIVTNLYDPDHNQGLERVAVKLPALGSNVEVWARLSSLYAGSKDGEKRGMVFRPEQGDEVLVGFVDDDPTQAAILGSLYHNNNCTAPVTAKDNGNDNHLKGIYSRTGMAIEFDDSNKDKPILTITSPGGREIIIDDANDKSITLKDKKNSIVLNDSGITLESQGDIVFKTKTGAVNIDAVNFDAQLKGQFQFKANAANLETQAINQITGTPINLNK